MKIRCLCLLVFIYQIISGAEFAMAEKPVLRCGVITAQSGPLAAVGSALKNAVILATKKNISGHKVEFLFEDDQFLAKNTLTAAYKLIDSDHIKCLITFGSTTSLAVADIAEKAKIPMISIAISPKVTEARPHVFRAYVPIERQNMVIIAEMKKRQYKSVAVVSTIQDATLAVRDYFVMTNQDVKILLNEEVLPEDRDLNTFATKIKLLNPSAVFVNLLPPQMSILSKQLRNKGYQGEFFSGPPLGNPDEIKASNGALLGSWFASIDDTKVNSFYKDYEETFNLHAPMEAIYGFESANLIINNAEHADLFDSLKSLKSFSGLLGEYSITNQVIDFPAIAWKVTAEGFAHCD